MSLAICRPRVAAEPVGNLGQVYASVARVAVTTLAGAQSAGRFVNHPFRLRHDNSGERHVQSIEHGGFLPFHASGDSQ